MPERMCRECGEKLLGRTDKRFCADYCRNAYHNRKNKDSCNLIRNTNNRLRKNYRILKSFPLRDGKTATTKARLHQMGFDFDLITALYVTRKGARYRFIYDLGYLQLKNEVCMIVRRTAESERQASAYFQL